MIGEGFRSGDRVLPLVDRRNFFHYYSAGRFPQQDTPGDPLDAGVDWEAGLRGLEHESGCVWIVVPVRRQRLAKELENWLFRNASLVWRHHSTRFDYKVEGYEVFVAGTGRRECVDRVNRR